MSALAKRLSCGSAYGVDAVDALGRSTRDQAQPQDRLVLVRCARVPVPAALAEGAPAVE